MLKSFLIVLLFLFGLQANGQGCLKANIMILADFSGSESGNELLLANAVNSFVTELPISNDGIKVGISIFSSENFNVCPLTGKRKIIEENLKILYRLGASGGTYILSSLIESIQFFQSDNDRGAVNIIIIISDGEIGDINESIIFLKNYNNYVGVFAIQIGGDTSGHMNLIRFTRNPRNVLQSTYLELIDALRKLDICG